MMINLKFKIYYLNETIYKKIMYFYLYNDLEHNYFYFIISYLQLRIKKKNIDNFLNLYKYVI